MDKPFTADGLKREIPIHNNMQKSSMRINCGAMAIFLFPAVFAFGGMAGAQQMEYVVESVPAVLQELRKTEHETEVKKWLKKERPALYREMTGEKTGEAEPDKKDSGAGGTGDLFSAFADLAVALESGPVMLLDYHLNAKARQGWKVVSVSEKIIVWQREVKDSKESK